MQSFSPLQSPRPAYALTLAALTWHLAIIWLQPGPPTLFGVDAAVYAQVAKEMATRTGALAWLNPTLEGAPFYEHPPGLMLLLGALFRLGGATPGLAVGTAHMLATLLVLAVAQLAHRLCGPYGAGFALVGLAAQSAWYRECHNPMLELPLVLVCTVSLLGLVRLGAAEAQTPRARAPWAWLWAVGGAVAALWSKGPVALLLAPCAVALVALGRLPQRQAWQFLLSVSLAAAASIAAFERARAHVGLPPFWPTYLSHQVWPSMHTGRHHPVANLTYYGPLLMRWYAAGVLTAGVGLLLHARRTARPGRAAYVLGLVWLITVVVGFSLMRQKYQWYLHAALPALALITGGVGTVLPERWRTRAAWGLAGVLATASLALGAATRLIPARIGPRTPPSLVALQKLASGPHPPLRTVALCGLDAGWRERYVARFTLDATLVECQAPADATYQAGTWRIAQP